MLKDIEGNFADLAGRVYDVTIDNPGGWGTA